jgi:hypothetical protein
MSCPHARDRTGTGYHPLPLGSRGDIPASIILTHRSLKKGREKLENR